MKPETGPLQGTFTYRDGVWYYVPAAAPTPTKK